MRTDGESESDNIEDLRGHGPGRMMVGGGLGAIVIALIAMFLGVDPRNAGVPGGSGSSAGGPSSVGSVDPREEPLRHFVAVVLKETENVWHLVFRGMGNTYRDPKLVLFSGQVDSACGNASAAIGPFYCPGDRKVYLDLSFFQELKSRFKAPGDFAIAYVIAHEVGHHVQNLLGTSDQVHQKQRRVSAVESNRLSVRLELQADYFAGVWAHHADRTKKLLEEGDVEEAMQAATAIGDDKLQREARGRVVPDAFTHGTSAQRVRWFLKGFKTGDMTQGDTFSIPYEDL